MSEEQRFGDGQDNYLQGMKQAADAAKQFGAAAGGAGALALLRERLRLMRLRRQSRRGQRPEKRCQELQQALRSRPVGRRPVSCMVAQAYPVQDPRFHLPVPSLHYHRGGVPALHRVQQHFPHRSIHVDPNGPTEVSANFDDLSAVVSECIQAAMTPPGQGRSNHRGRRL